MGVRCLRPAIGTLCIVIAAFPTVRQTKWRLPATIEAVQDVSAQPVETGRQARGVLYVGRGNLFTIKKGQRFLMVKVAAEGGCRIEYEKNQYDVSSCPWLDGFRDHQEDFFKVVAGRVGGRLRDGVLAKDGQPNSALHPTPAAEMMGRRG
jgi:hypothetical protein